MILFMNPIVRFFSRITIYAVIAFGLIFCLKQPINAQAPGGQAIKYYGVDRGNPVTDANYAILAQHSVRTIIVDTDVKGNASAWQNIVTLTTKYNFNFVIWPSDSAKPRGSGCGWSSPYPTNPVGGDYIADVKPLLDAIGGNPRFIGIVNAHEPYTVNGAPGSCYMTPDELATIRTQLKDYVRNKYGRDIQVWAYIDNIFDRVQSANIARIMDVAVTWQHCFGSPAEGSCDSARQRMINDRNAIHNAGLDGKVDLIYLFQTFAQGTKYRMPTATEMHDEACKFLNTGMLDGFIWYTWGACWYASDLYCPESTHPNQNLWPVMNVVYNECVNKSSPSPTPPSGSKPGDANGDNRVDGLDYVIWLNHFNQTTTAGPSAGDFNRSGKVDGLDYVVWLNNFGK